MRRPNDELLKSIAGGTGVRFLRVDLTKAAAAAGCSATLIKRYLVGERVGERSRRRIEEALGLRRVPDQP